VDSGLAAGGPEVAGSADAVETAGEADGAPEVVPLPPHPMSASPRARRSESLVKVDEGDTVRLYLRDRSW
jgi:hypothetical protein